MHIACPTLIISLLFNLIDINNWVRKEYYNHYMHKVCCTYSVTSNIDITGVRTALKSMNKKIYPAQIYMLTTVVNQYQEFRMNIDCEGNLGFWDELNPSYTIFNKEKELFSSIWVAKECRNLCGLRWLFKPCRMPHTSRRF